MSGEELSLAERYNKINNNIKNVQEKLSLLRENKAGMKQHLRV